MGKFNKATAAVVAGSVVTLIGAFIVLDPDLQSAIQTVLTAALVWLIPNRESNA